MMQICLLYTSLKAKHPNRWMSLTPYERKKFLSDAFREAFMEKLYSATMDEETEIFEEVHEEVEYDDMEL